jgi:GxxExxY protein
MDEFGLSDPLSEKVLGCVFEVAIMLGAGFPEKVYERALLVELRRRGLRAFAQEAVPVCYKGHRVGDFFRICWLRTS